MCKQVDTCILNTSLKTLEPTFSTSPPSNPTPPTFLPHSLKLPPPTFLPHSLKLPPHLSTSPPSSCPPTFLPHLPQVTPPPFYPTSLKLPPPPPFYLTSLKLPPHLSTAPPSTCPPPHLSTSPPSTFPPPPPPQPLLLSSPCVQSQVHELKQAQTAEGSQLHRMLIDPAVNLVFKRMKSQLSDYKEKLEQAQSDLSAWKFTPDRLAVFLPTLFHLLSVPFPLSLVPRPSLLLSSILMQQYQLTFILEARKKEDS